jgi:hypothetical protein
MRLGALLELNVIPQQRETPRRHDNKIIARATNQDYARRHQETGKPGNQKDFKKALTCRRLPD